MPYVSLESVNVQNHFIRHAHFLGELNPISSQLDREDATFFILDGALEDLRPVVLRSVNFPLHALRHQDFRLELHEYNPSLIPPPGLRGGQQTPEQRLLREDSTYIAVRGNAARPASLSDPSTSPVGSFVTGISTSSLRTSMTTSLGRIRRSSSGNPSRRRPR